MSRIGKLIIKLPEGTSADIKGTTVRVKGKLGELSLDHHPHMTVVNENGEVSVKRASDLKEDRALHGLTRALIANMVQGVTEGFKKELSVVGVGYRADMKKDMVVLNVGYSQPKEYKLPKGIDVEIDKQNNITITGIDKQQVGQVAAEIRAIRPPDSYKGKGIRYKDEKVRLKEGKSGV